MARLFVLVTCLALLCAHALSAVFISEVQYKPRYRSDLFEFVELYNDADSAVDVSKWKLTGSGFDFFPPSSLPSLVFIPSGHHTASRYFLVWI